MTIKIRVSSPTFGDFLNGFPVYDAIARKYGTFELVLPGAMRIFNGMREFVEYQDFAKVLFDGETDNTGHYIRPGIDSSRKLSPTRPFETCGVENDIKNGLGLDFEVDDDYCLKVPDIAVHVEDYLWAGDRWNRVFDHRRQTNTLGRKFNNMRYLDFELPILVNLKIIEQSKYPFVSTFTGVSILADLIKKPNYVLWAEDMRNFAGLSAQTSFEKHYYSDRKSILMYIEDFKPEEIEQIS